MAKPVSKAQAKKAAAKKQTGRATPKPKAKAPASVDELFSGLDHPLAAEITAVRKTILSADKSISDGVKWNSLSFQTTEWFATVNLRSRDSVQLVMHLGAKAGKAADSDAIPDPKDLLKWLGKDRAMAALPAFKAIVKAWIRYV